MFQRAVATAAPAPAPPKQTMPSLSQQKLHALSPPSNRTSQLPLHPRSRPALSTAKPATNNSVTSFVKKRPADNDMGGIKKVLCASELKFEGVFFSENDFEDDDQLNFDDDDDLPTQPALPPSVTIAPVQNSNLNLNSQNMDPPPSSGPLPWSSSPAPSHSPGFEDDDMPLAQRTNRKMAVQKTTRRTLPWKNPVKREPTEVKMETEMEVSEPAKIPRKLGRTKSNALWDQSPDTIKAKQKEMKTTLKTKKDVIIKGEKSNKQPDVAPIFLSEEQRSVLKLVVDSGKSVFFTGSAGTGKSVLMKEIIKQLKDKFKHDTDHLAVTASTGLAACNIGGITLHSFAGVGLAREDKAELLKRARKNAKARMRWQRTKVLVIDEISMVDGELFDKLEYIAKKIRNNGKSFGGIQLVITGDFFQLPPVPDNGKIAKFAFEAETWKTCVDCTIKLTHVFRQRDEEFAGMLNEMRIGKLSQASIAKFRALSRPITYTDGMEATQLFPTRYEVENANRQKMNLLHGAAKEFTAIDGGTLEDPVAREKLLANCMAPKRIELKLDSQVLLIKNIDEQLVNGSQGKVIGFMSERHYEILAGEGVLDSDISLSQSNQTSKRTKMLMDLAAKGTTADTTGTWPLVQFIVPGGYRQYLVKPEIWKIELPNGEVQASRTQVPLILAWALSIHKAQGQTLERVKVDLTRAFEKGQVYVALSRATCQEGLQVLGFDPRKVMAHPKVCAFYSKLDAAQAVLASVQEKRAQEEEAKKKRKAKREKGGLGGALMRYAVKDDDEEDDLFGDIRDLEDDEIIETKWTRKSQ